MEIRSLLHKLYARRRLKQFTWEYVKARFAEPAMPKTQQVEKEEYDKVVKLFGEEYAAKRFRPRYSFSLQASFGDLASREGCKKLLALFEYELYKSRFSGKRKKEKFEARQYLKMFDPTPGYDELMSAKDPTYVHDRYYEEAYCGKSYKPKTWDPYSPEVS